MPYELYIVQTRFGHTWENCWQFEDADGQTKPMTFETLKDAKDDLKQFLDDIKQAVADGDMDEAYDPEDYRIVKL